MDIHAEAFHVFTDRHGLPPLDDAMRHRIDGRRNRDIFPILFDDDLDKDVVRAHTHEKESLYREISKGRLQPVAGVTDFLAYLRQRDIPYAIATSAPEENVPHSLGEIGLESQFDIVVRGDQVPRGKTPSRCLLGSRQTDRHRAKRLPRL